MDLSIPSLTSESLPLRIKGWLMTNLMWIVRQVRWLPHHKKWAKQLVMSVAVSVDSRILWQSTHGWFKIAPLIGPSVNSENSITLAVVCHGVLDIYKATGSTAKNKLLKRQLLVTHAEKDSQVEKRESVVSQLQSSLGRVRSENLMALFKYTKRTHWLIKNDIPHSIHYQFDRPVYWAKRKWHPCKLAKQRLDNATYKSIATCTEMVQTGGYIDGKNWMNWPCQIFYH